MPARPVRGWRIAPKMCVPPARQVVRLLNRHGYLALLTLALALLPAAASAQGVEQDPISAAKFRFGPIGVTPSIGVQHLGLDTNVFNEDRAPKHDVTASFVPQAEVWLRLGRARLRGLTHTELVYFQKYETERSVNTRSQLRLEMPVNRLQPFVEVGLVKSRQRPGYEIDARARRIEGTITVGGQIRISRNTSLELVEHRSRVNFDPDAEFLGTRLRDVLNRDVERTSASVRYRLTPLTTIVFLADAQRDSFDLSAVRDSRSLKITPGVEFGSRALISGRAFLGYHRFDALAREVPDYRGLAASVDLGYTLRRSTRFAVRAERDVTYSFEISEPYYVLTGFRGSITQVILARWDVRASAGTWQLDYRRAAGQDISNAHVDRMTTYGIGVGHRINRDMRVGIDSEYYRRRSDAEGRQHRGVRTGLSVAYGF